MRMVLNFQNLIKVEYMIMKMKNKSNKNNMINNLLHLTQQIMV